MHGRERPAGRAGRDGRRSPRPPGLQRQPFAGIADKQGVSAGGLGFDVLQAYAREHDYPCIGMLVELENTKFSTALRAPVWTSTGFVYIGKSQRNLDLRVRYFKGARLKKS